MYAAPLQNNNLNIVSRRHSCEHGNIVPGGSGPVSLGEVRRADSSISVFPGYSQVPVFSKRLEDDTHTRLPGGLGAESPGYEAPIHSSVSILSAGAPGGTSAQGGFTQPGAEFLAPAILDIPTPVLRHYPEPPPTPLLRHFDASIKRGLSRVSRRLYSRVLLGLKLPGRYYFITWTSSPQSPPIEKSWIALKKWLRRKRPGASWCYCITSEGYGVIHMVMRLGKGEKRLDVKEVRAHWVNLHKANQIRIEHIPESMKNNLAAYLGDQRSKKRLGGEMAWQDGIIRWRWGTGWLPKGFTKQFGRLWWDLQDISLGQREKAVSDWLNACHVNEDKVRAMPKLGPENEIVYPPVPAAVDIPGLEQMKQYDIDLKKMVSAMTEKIIPHRPAIDDSVSEDLTTKLLWKTRFDARNRRCGII